MDCHDGPNGPRVYHGHTLTSQINFEDILIAVKQFAFKVSK